MRLKNVLLVVEDIELSRTFYRDLFGLQMIKDFDGNMILTEGVVLQDRKIWERLTGLTVTKKGNDAELYFEENNLEDFQKKLDGLPYPIEYVNRLMTHSWGQRVIRIYDPDQHVIEIGEPFV